MRNPWLCIAIVGTLGLTILIGVIGMVVLALYGRPTPTELVAVVTTCTGAMSSFLVQPPRGSIGVGSPTPLPPPQVRP